MNNDTRIAARLSLDYPALYTAWRRFRKGKCTSIAIDEFAYDLEAKLERLAIEINDGSYKHGLYDPVILFEKKRRDLAVATVRDRVIHRLLYDYLVAAMRRLPLRGPIPRGYRHGNSGRLD